MDAEYNDVVNWKYTRIPAALGATDEQFETFQVRTKDELDKLLTDQEFNQSNKLQFVELFMRRDDAPRALKLTAEISARTNAKVEEEMDGAAR